MDPTEEPFNTKMGACLPGKCSDENSQQPTLEQCLQAIDIKTVPKVPLQNQFTLARIEEVYDGDTVKIIVLLSDTPLRFSLRILGIDTPELKHGEGRLPEEHLAAVKVRDYVKSLFPTNIAKIRIHDWDKYGGRVLGDLFLPTGENVSEILIKCGWARPYHGEKKRSWTLEQLTSKPFV
jgi:endonuclease YncB( thermonuclease family)